MAYLLLAAVVKKKQQKSGQIKATLLGFAITESNGRRSKKNTYRHNNTQKKSKEKVGEGERRDPLDELKDIVSLGQKIFLSTKIWVFFIPFPSFIYSYRIYHHHHLVWYSKNHSLHMAHHGLRSFLPDPVRPEKLSAILQHGLNLFTVERLMRM